MTALSERNLSWDIFWDRHRIDFDGWDTHTWNAVNIGEDWYLLDATWGAGGAVNGEGGKLRFQKNFRDEFFLVPPEKLILDHFPPEPRWQLLKKPVTLEELKRSKIR